MQVTEFDALCKRVLNNLDWCRYEDCVHCELEAANDGLDGTENEIDQYDPGSSYVLYFDSVIGAVCLDVYAGSEKLSVITWTMLSREWKNNITGQTLIRSWKLNANTLQDRIYEELATKTPAKHGSFTQLVQ